MGCKQKAGESPKVDHFCVSVAGYDPATVTAGLKDLGAEILPATDEAQDRARFRDLDLLRFKDPNGVIVELRGRLVLHFRNYGHIFGNTKTQRRKDTKKDRH